MSRLKGLHMVTGEKGGVGKSLFSMTLLEYCRAAGIAYRFFDADRTSPDVGAVYGERPDLVVKTSGKKEYRALTEEDFAPKIEEEPLETDNRPLYFSEEIEERFLADRLVEYAEKELVIVNLPAQVRADSF